MARPTKFSHARVNKILEAVRLGQPLMRAAQTAGIGYETFREWREQSVSFREQLEQATAEGELHVLGSLRQAADEGSVTAMLGWLERRFPDEWGKRERIDVNHSGAVDVRHVVRQVQAALDAVLPDDGELRGRVAQKLIELDDAQAGEDGTPWAS